VYGVLDTILLIIKKNQALNPSLEIQHSCQKYPNLIFANPLVKDVTLLMTYIATFLAMNDKVGAHSELWCLCYGTV